MTARIVYNYPEHGFAGHSQELSVDIQNEVRRFLETRAPKGVRLTDDESLLTSGVIDSLTMLDLVGFIEQRFGTPVNEDEMMPENFETINDLVRFLHNKREGNA